MILDTLNVLKLLGGGTVKIAQVDATITTDLRHVPYQEWADICVKLDRPPPDPHYFTFTGRMWESRKPWYHVGETFLVKEKWAISRGALEEDRSEWAYQGWSVWYGADGACKRGVWSTTLPEKCNSPGIWRPASQMPSWASRL